MNEPIEKLNLDSLTRDELIVTSKYFRSELIRERSRIELLRAEIRSLAARLEIAETRLAAAQSALDLYEAMREQVEALSTTEGQSTEAAA